MPVPAAVTLMPLFYSRSTIETAAGEGTKADGRAAFTEGRLFCLCVRLRHRSPRKFQRADVLIEVFVNSTRAFERSCRCRASACETFVATNQHGCAGQARA